MEQDNSQAIEQVPVYFVNVGKLCAASMQKIISLIFFNKLNSDLCGEQYTTSLFQPSENMAIYSTPILQQY